MAAFSGVRLFGWGDPNQRVFLTGHPRSISGQVWVENDEGHELQLSRASVVSDALGALEPATPDRFARIQIPRVILARQRRPLPVSIQLDRSTRPGAYDASIVLEGPDGVLS